MTENYGVVLESSSSAIYHSSRTNVSSGVHPYFSIVYVNSTGLESRFSYSDQDAGAAGAGSVNLFSGNLTFSFADASVATEPCQSPFPMYTTRTTRIQISVTATAGA